MERGILSLGPMAITSKLIGARGRKQAEKLGIDPARVPPGQYLTEKFPVLSVGRNPKFHLTDWDLRLDVRAAPCRG